MRVYVCMYCVCTVLHSHTQHSTSIEKMNWGAMHISRLSCPALHAYMPITVLHRALLSPPRQRWKEGRKPAPATTTVTVVRNRRGVEVQCIGVTAASTTLYHIPQRHMTADRMLALTPRSPPPPFPSSLSLHRTPGKRPRGGRGRGRWEGRASPVWGWPLN